MKQLAAWYQKKISSYDKEEWETMVEQLLMKGTYRRRIVDFSSHARSYLIDVDLVRGSSFPKAKPTLGVRRVVWYALVRLVFLPFLYQWWKEQTSSKCAKFLIAVWTMQVANMVLYFLAPPTIDVDANTWLVPLGLMLVLSIVHSQIVSTTEMEVGRVRPRSTFRRKLPRYPKRSRSECDGGSGGGSAESAATSTHSKTPSNKPMKYRRRLPRADVLESGLRKRKTELTKGNILQKLVPSLKTKSLVKVKAKDSDEEDYLLWRNRGSTAPIVTFTPPQDESTPGTSYEYRNLLTKKRLETFNIRQSNPSKPLADGDDGFESLNGNNSNGSDGDNRVKDANTNTVPDSENQNIVDIDKVIENNIENNIVNDKLNPVEETKKTVDDLSDSKNDVPKTKDCRQNETTGIKDGRRCETKGGRQYETKDGRPYETKDGRKYRINGTKDGRPYETIDGRQYVPEKENIYRGNDKEKIYNGHGKEKMYSGNGVLDVDSDGAEPTSSPSEGKRPGVRFRNSCVQDTIEQDSSDDFTVRPTSKQKKLENYQSSTSDGECSASAPSIALPSHHTMSDWVGQTTNSDENSYGSQSDDDGNPDVGFRYPADEPWDPFAILNPTSDTVKCTMWECGDVLRAELSAVDISWYVVARAERAMATDEGYLWAGVAMAWAVAALSPSIRLVQMAIERDTRTEEELQAISLLSYIPLLIVNFGKDSLPSLFYGAFGDNSWEISTNILSCLLRFTLSGLVFFLLAVAERAFKQRFLYAKLFSHLTSARRARKSELPHFRLNTVRNIKTWLSTRSYLRRRGPQRSVDVIVSAAFMLTLILLACVSAHLLRDSVSLECGWLLQAMAWSCCLGVYLLRLLTLGSNVNRKYRGCLSAILTEQINLHLAIEQRPQNKDQLTVANNVLKLAADLLKELDSPFRISGLCANHYLYTITKVVILSALSGVLSEMLGFKLKLHKIKIK